ncbi:MAG: CrcB family protein [Acidimicrobiales bacterium]|nr:CrcB family protein [Acidimicrobiales bacterium]
MRTGLLQSPVLLVAGGGALGAGARWVVLEALPVGSTEGVATAATLAAVGDGLPWPLVLVNLVGCALLGVVLGRGADSRVRLLIGTGFCGGLTTFSTFAVDAAGLMRDARVGAAATYLALSVVLGLGAFLTGRRFAGTSR